MTTFSLTTLCWCQLWFSAGCVTTSFWDGTSTWLTSATMQIWWQYSFWCSIPKTNGSLKFVLCLVMEFWRRRWKLFEIRWCTTDLIIWPASAAIHSRWSSCTTSGGMWCRCKQNCHLNNRDSSCLASMIYPGTFYHFCLICFWFPWAFTFCGRVFTLWSILC